MTKSHAKYHKQIQKYPIFIRRQKYKIQSYVLASLYLLRQRHDGFNEWQMQKCRVAIYTEHHSHFQGEKYREIMMH